MAITRHRHGLLPVWEPFRAFRQLERMMGDMLARPLRHTEAEPEMWIPAMDIHQTDGELIVSFELPGVQKEKVEVDSSEQRLIVKGERAMPEATCPEGSVCCTEFTYGPFERSVRWPVAVKHGDAEAHFHDGILEVKVPIAESTQRLKPTRVRIE